MKILRADHLGMCFGVREAIALARHEARLGPLTILGDLVHNESVLADLRRLGIQIENDPDRIVGGRVMVSAHGASHRRMQVVRERGLTLREATCPLVRLAHRAVQQLAADGFHPVIVGVRDHVEVRGLTEDLDEFDVVLTELEIDRLGPRQRYGVAAQTTQPIDRVRHLVQRLRQRFPDSVVRFVDTVCQPTKQRQNAAMELAQQCDVVIVVGGARSNNTRELVATCGRFCDRVHHVQGPTELEADWMIGAHTVGLTAGTSTPDRVIDAVEQQLGILLRQAVGHA